MPATEQCLIESLTEKAARYRRERDQLAAVVKHLCRCVPTYWEGNADNGVASRNMTEYEFDCASDQVAVALTLLESIERQ